MSFSGGTIKAAGNIPPGSRVVVCIRPESIKLTRARRDQVPSGSNRFTAKVASISPWISHYRIEVKCENIPVVAFIDGAAFLDVAPRTGEEVLVFFAPEAAHVITV